MSLKIGRKQTWARIDAVYIGKTYAGMLEGVPTKDQNDDRIERLKEKAIKRIGWGPFGESGTKVYGKKAHPILIAPQRKTVDLSKFSETTQRAYPGPERLPDYYVFAMIDGSATDKEFCGAAALVIFFADDLTRPLEDMVNEACAEEVWEYMAYNYDV